MESPLPFGQQRDQSQPSRCIVFLFRDTQLPCSLIHPRFQFLAFHGDVIGFHTGSNGTDPILLLSQSGDLCPQVIQLHVDVADWIDLKWRRESPSSALEASVLPLRATFPPPSERPWPSSEPLALSLLLLWPVRLAFVSVRQNFWSTGCARTQVVLVLGTRPSRVLPGRQGTCRPFRPTWRTLP